MRAKNWRRYPAFCSSYPNLKLQVEGYTDNIGSEEYNQKLSEERADSVRDYLVTEGVAQPNISAAGYGKSDPVADNSTSSGRAENRRVQLVVSGNAIGVQETAPAPGGQSMNQAPSAARSPTRPAFRTCPSNNLLRFEGRSLDPPVWILGAAFTFVIQSELTLIQRSAVTEAEECELLFLDWERWAEPLLATSLNAGHELTVWNRTPQNAEQFTDTGSESG